MLYPNTLSESFKGLQYCTLMVHSFSKATILYPYSTMTLAELVAGTHKGSFKGSFKVSFTGSCTGSIKGSLSSPCSSLFRLEGGLPLPHFREAPAPHDARVRVAPGHLGVGP